MADDQATPTQPRSWDEAVADYRDMGLKYLNSALNAAGGTSGGITRNTFQFPVAPPSSVAPAAKQGLSTLVKTGLAAAAICGTGGLAGIPFLVSAFLNKAPAPVVQHTDQNIGVTADLLVDPPVSQ